MLGSWRMCLALSVGACGGGGGGSPTADGSIDAATDAAGGPVTIHALGRDSGGGPRAGVFVLFYAPDGTLVGRTTTDAAGTASGIVPDGGSVTVVEDVERVLTTIVGVTSGDTLTVGDYFWAPPLRHTSIAVPPGPDPGDHYVVWGPCALSDFSPSPVAETLWACAPASGPLIAAAFQHIDVGNQERLRGYLYAPDVALTDGGTATITGSWLPPITFDISVTGLPPSVQGGTFNASRFTAGQQLYLFQSGSFVAGGGTYTGQYPLAGGGDGLMTELSLEGAGTGRNEILEYRTGTPTSLVGNLASDVISRPIDPQQIYGALGVVGGSWTMPTAGDYDGIVLDTSVVNASFDITRWRVILPPVPAGAATYRFPSLPSDLVALWGDKMNDNFTVMAVDTPVASYAAFRRDADPEVAWRWMRAPVVPSVVRIGTTF